VILRREVVDIERVEGLVVQKSQWSLNPRKL
jgi:hypothetical protein